MKYLGKKTDNKDIATKGDIPIGSLAWLNKLAYDSTELTNRPKINNVTLIGNKTSHDLALQAELATPLTEDLYLVDGTAPTLADGTYYTGTHKIYVNGTEASEFNNVIFKVYHDETNYGFSKIYGGNSYDLAIISCDLENSNVYFYGYTNWVKQEDITTTMPSNVSPSIWNKRVPSTKLFKTQLDLKANTSSIPTVNNATITITQGGVTKGTFTTNQSSASTIALDAGSSSTVIPLTEDLYLNDYGESFPDLVSGGIYYTGDYCVYVNNGLASGFSQDQYFLYIASDNEYDSHCAFYNIATDPHINYIYVIYGYYSEGDIVFHTETQRCLSSSNINTTLPFSPSDSNVPSTKLLKTQLQLKADSSSLATVATSGDYDDLDNKPTIPTVNDTTITITQGGVTKGTFTTNQGTASTIALDAGGGSNITISSVDIGEGVSLASDALYFVYDV